MRIVAIKHCETCNGNGIIRVCDKPGCLTMHRPSHKGCPDCDGTGHEIVYSDLD